MAITNGYATLAEFKKHIDTTSTNADDDAVIEDIIEGISRLIDAECRRHFYQVTEARYFTAQDLDVLFCGDISTTTGLEIKTQLNSDGTYQYTWASTDYNLLPYSPRFGFPYTWIETSRDTRYSFDLYKKGNKITATWGWAAVPDEVKTACLEESANEYRRRNGENSSTTATITGAGVVLSPQGLSKNTVLKLARFRVLS